MFAMTLDFYSPKACRYIRNKFGKHFPAKSTIRAWYANSREKSVSGFCKQAIEILRQRATDLKNDGIEPCVAIIFDEMAIRKAVKWHDPEKTFVGHITYGFRPEDSHLPVANNALVFMLNGINFDICIPMARYFIKSLKTEEKVALLKDVIVEVTQLGVRVLTVTFDGLSTNFTTCESLGAVFDVDSMKPYFVVPGIERKIHVIMDPSHILKLIRNTLANNSVLSDDLGGKIKWEYFKQLNQLRVNSEFGHVHKLTNQHIDFKGCKMKVRIAAETFSNSVANALQFLKNDGQKAFSDSSATI